MERGPSIHFRIDSPDRLYGFRLKVKTQDFWEDGRETIDRGREKFVTFEKLSEIFRKKPETIEHYIFNRVFHQFTLGTNFPENLLKISVRQ